ncbi:hypothetical protein [uncultured Bacteroides sp.]|uniref:hypothetical protein n=1 Tax=uncultured Bacteroides sp. TaxID=162156 RepID=UPI0026240331|nr:hypothetical protein [uncultured Bacteroides sp.]
MKLFITSKIYDTETKTIAEIDKAVQEDIDNYVGKGKVIFKLYIIGKTAAMYFYRRVDYASLHADPKDMIIDADAYLITGEGYEGFRMPVQFYKVRLQCNYSMEQSEFLKAYKDSAELLGVDKIKKAWLEIDGEKIILNIKL